MRLHYDGTEPRVFVTGGTVYVEPGQEIDVEEEMCERLLATGCFTLVTPPADTHGHKEE